jgi:dienelactone hydrolase
MMLIPAILLLVAAQEDLTVLEAGPGGPPSKMLDRYLQGEAAKLFEERRKAVGAIKTPEELRRRQEDLRTRFVAALGGYPERTPLNPRVVGKEDRAGCRVERVIYESRPGHHVTAVLYLPEGTAPFPGVLFPCGHSENGKAAEAYQRACILLARNGMAVLCYDPIGQGERKQLLAIPPGKQNIGNTTEHTLAGVGALLVGRCAASYRVWDGLRSMDYLASRPEVDPSRLGCTGNSGGGTMTAYLMALDDRIRCAAPSCYITSLERLFATIGPQDAEQNIPGQVAFGMEHADYVTMRAPKPTLICIATRDFFDREGALATFGEAKRLYGVMGKAEGVDLFEFNDTHGFSRPRREAAMRWMRRWLLEKDDAPTEPDFPVARDAEMQCTETGQVLRDLKGKSVFDLNAGRARELAAARSAKDLPGEVRRRIGFRPPAAGLNPESRGEVRRGDVVLEKLVYRTEPGIAVPAVRLKAGAAGKPVVVYVSGEGKGVAARREGPAEALAKAGHVVVVPDLRGWGETSPEDKGGKRRLLGADCNEAFLGLHLNRPLLGQRVYDLLCLIDSIGGEVEVVGEGAAGPVVLHAAVLDSRIRKTTIDGSILSWAAVVESPIGYGQLANAVPGALESYDLPDLAAALAPRPLEIRSPVAPAGGSLTQESLDGAYAACRTAYERAGAGDRLALRAGR